MTQTLYSIFSTLPFCLCLFWWVLLLIRRKAVSSPAHPYLAMLAFANMLLCFCHVVFFQGEDNPLIRILYFISKLAVFPLYWIYIRVLTEPERPRKRALWVLAPSVLTGVVLAVILACGGDPARLDLPVRLLFLAQLIPLFISVERRLTLFDRKVRNFYVDTEHKSLRDLQILFYLMVPVAVFSALGGILGNHFFVARQITIIPSLLLGALLFSIFHVGFLMEYTAAEMAAGTVPEAELDQEAGDVEDDRAQLALLERIRELVESKKMYLIPGLKITDMAEALDTNRTYISSCINRQTGMSFSDYINSFRVRHAQALLLKQDPRLSVTQIGTRSGFSGDTSFFRNFKKITGQTPTEWLASQ